MQENRTIENPPLDCEDWQIAFKPYVKHPYLALALAQHLSALRDYVENDAVKATAAISRAVDALFEHSEFRAVSLELFRATAEGQMPVEVENVIRKLGIRT